MIDDINKNIIQGLNKRLEVIIENNKSLKSNTKTIYNLFTKTHTDLKQRYQIRNNYYRKKFPLALNNLCNLKSNKIFFQLIEKEYYESIKFYRNISNIQLSIDIKQYNEQAEKSTKILEDLKSDTIQYENSIEQFKKECIQQNEKLKDYANQLFQIQYEQSQIQSDIKNLKQKILFEKKLYSEEKQTLLYFKITSRLTSTNISQENKPEHTNGFHQQQKNLIEEEIALKNLLHSIKNSNQSKLIQCHSEYNHLLTEISHIKQNIQQTKSDLLSLKRKLSSYKIKSNMNRIIATQAKTRTLFVPKMGSTSNKQEIVYQSAPILNKIKNTLLDCEQNEQLSNESTIKSEQNKTKTMPMTAKLHRSESLGPSLQSRLEALEAAMGVRLNLAKRQGRHSLSNTASSSPMQLSPTSSSTTTKPVNTSTNLSNSLSLSTRHNIPLRTGQGVQRSASSCDAENRPGPIKRLKPSLPNDNCSSTSSSTNVTAVTSTKKYPPSVRRTLPMANMTPPRPTQSKQSTPIKQRSSPMDISSPRLSRSSTASSNSSSNSSNYRTPMGGNSPKVSNTPSPKQLLTSSSSNISAINLRKRSQSIFGEQFSDDIIKTNLLWIELKELDDETRSEVILQFGSIENFLRQQNIFFTKQQLQFKNVSKNKTTINRSRYHLSLTKKDRLELL